MRVTANREVCVGAGMCALTAPEVFDQDEEDGRVHLLTEKPLDEQQEKVREAERLCPSRALGLSD
ncbi:ferredoxin [Spiractinospora alimapuensis]|uniref:ferredoxin n=1 Tax=Spiractinospora alimapuensis TaxID=2820884 RepID=UPI001F43DF50|nr:ferredoxin [Spiractinospora alimapuensis]QVQ53414.1 ferredoxin [Spiractinospora alimapuensis]